MSEMNIFYIMSIQYRL